MGLMFALTSGIATADLSNPDDWQRIHTGNTILCFKRLDDLCRFNARINYIQPCHENKKKMGQNADSSLADTIARKVDALFERSRDLLEMKGFTNKIIVKIYRNQKELGRAFYGLYKRKCTARAWYTHETLTVYIQLDDLHEGMLAHEFAHAIIDHYMIVPLPSKSAEILARYVDIHLQEDGPQNHQDPLIKAFALNNAK